MSRTIRQRETFKRYVDSMRCGWCRGKGCGHCKSTGDSRKFNRVLKAATKGLR